MVFGGDLQGAGGQSIGDEFGIDKCEEGVVAVGGALGGHLLGGLVGEDVEGGFERRNHVRR